MKNLKIVFASLLLAVMGVVGFSSFTTTSKKLTQVEYKFTTIWEPGTPTGCGGNAQYCGFTFDDENGLEPETVLENIPSLEAIRLNPDVVIEGTTVHFLLKN